MSQPGRLRRLSGVGHDADIAVAGGTGSIGREVVRALAAAGHPVRVVSRRPAAPGFLPPGAWHVRADVTDPASLRAALAGAAVVVDAVNNTDQRRAERLLPAGTRAMVDAAAAEQCRHLSAESTSLVIAGRDDHTHQQKEEDNPQLQAA